LKMVDFGQTKTETRKEKHASMKYAVLVWTQRLSQLMKSFVGWPLMSTKLMGVCRFSSS